MTLLTFVRHGATDWNAERRFQGQTDVPLNELGRSQAHALSVALQGAAFDRAVSSDLSRAVETARAIRGGLFVETDARWREFDFGEWEGLTWEQIVQRWPAASESGATAAAAYAPSGGETFALLCDRVSAAIRDLRRDTVQNVLVVTHAGPLHAVLHVLFGEHRAEMQETFGVRFLPASITRIQMDANGAELRSLNDVSHLPALRN